MLDHLGLLSALAALSRGFTDRTGIAVDCRFDSHPPALDPDTELAVYRIVQESLTNVARHAGARHAELSLRSHAAPCSGRDRRRRPWPARRHRRRCRAARHARTRAALIGGQLTVDNRPAGGARVSLDLPAQQARPMTPTATRILVADDHAIVRHGLRLLLDREPDLTVVAEAADGAQAVDLGLAGSVDLVILDIAMPRMTGLQAARELSRRRPQLPMLILSMYDNDQFLFEALKAGASGYVLKSGADRDIVTACRVAIAGDCFLYPSATDHPRTGLLDSRRPDRRSRRRPHPPRGGDRQTHRRRPQLQADRRHPHHQHQDRRPAPRQHPRQARHARPGPADPLRHPPRPHRTLTNRSALHDSLASHPPADARPAEPASNLAVPPVSGGPPGLSRAGSTSRRAVTGAAGDHQPPFARCDLDHIIDRHRDRCRPQPCTTCSRPGTAESGSMSTRSTTPTSRPQSSSTRKS